MKVEVFRMYAGRNIPKGAKIVYDKSGKKRPAWVWIKGLPNNIVFIRLRINGERMLYQVYIAPGMPVFMPIDRTKEETKKFYDRFSKTYDKEVRQRNLAVAKFLVKSIKLPKAAKILDVGSGTGLSSLALARKGYRNITLLDYSKKMLDVAKQRKELKQCRFVQGDVRNFNLKEKFDLIISVFSFASNAYLDRTEMPAAWKEITKHLKPNGILALFGYDYEPPKVMFRKIKSGKRRIIKDYYANWYIGKRK